MKFRKLSLDESLFDNQGDMFFDDTYDDEFVDTDSPTRALSGPESGSDYGITDLFISAINDEWKTISAYNSIIETLKYESNNNPEYVAFISILNDINAEEHKHIGQLQEVLEKLSPNVSYIDNGREEGRTQFNFTNGQLQVQSWGTTRTSTSSEASCVDDMCTITDIDDEM